MLKHAGWLLLAMTLVACIAGEDGEMDADTPPAGTEDPDTPGTPPSTPPASGNNAAPVITTETITGQEGTPLDTTLRATDADGDTISFALVDGPEWLDVSTSGAVTGTPGGSDIEDGSITVTASDGAATTEADVDLEIAYDPIEQALRTGDYTIITDESELTLFEAMQEDTARTRERNNADIAEIFNLGSDGQANADSLTNVTWEYGSNAIFFNLSFSGSVPLLYANTDSNGQALESPSIVAAIGRQSNARFAVLGDNPFRLAAQDASTVNEDMHRLLENMTEWLIDADPHDGINVVIANLPESNTYRDQSATRNWLSDRFGDAVSYNSIGTCESTDLESCLTEETDLIFVSRDARTLNDPQLLKDGIEYAILEGIPVVYVHALGNTNPITSYLMDLLGLGSNTRNTDAQVTSGFSPVNVLTDWQSPEVTAIESLIDRIERDDLEYDFSGCTQYWQCPENTDFAAEVTANLAELRNQLKELDRKLNRAFPRPAAQRWQGFALLIGDYYRSLTRYPMSKQNTPSRDIVRAMYGDISTIIARDINPASNLGSFGENEFPDHLRTNKTVEMTTQRPFRTTGVYAFPGETVTVTRTDESDIAVNLKVHSVRDGANAPFRSNYDRPLFISSGTMPIAPGETRTITSAIGGPIQAFFAVTGEDISFEFENVGEHPVWRGPEDSNTFLNALASDDYDWVEFVTPYFEVHSRRSKMQQTLNRNYASTPSDLSDMIATYIRDWPHWLAGWEGPGVSENPDLQAFANAHGLDIPVLDIVKHMNADRPSCIVSAPNCAGTSGNPYDASWFFDPINLGDLHELGHGLEFRNRHRFENGDPSHSTTNLYSFHTSYRFYKASGGSNFTCWTLPYQDLYSTIQNSQSRADPSQYMRDADLSSYPEQNAIFMQLLTALESQGVFDDGWLMMPRLNLITREFQTSNNDTAWAAKAEGLGFGGMDRATAFSLSQNDWLLIALSWSAQRDLRDYLDMWGYIYSDDALAHVASLGLPSLQPAYYGIGSRGHCFGLTHNELPIDGRTAFSTSAASAKVAAFTPDYYAFSQHEHSEMCSLGDHLEDPS